MVISDLQFVSYNRKKDSSCDQERLLEKVAGGKNKPEPNSPIKFRYSDLFLTVSVYILKMLLS